MKIRFIVLYCFTCSVTQLLAQSTTISFNKEKWNTKTSTEANFAKFKDREALQLNGSLFLNNFMLEQGEISVDIFCDSNRSFAGLIFHDSGDNSEEVYLRKHKSSQADAIQYTPIFNNESNWQLYPQLQSFYTFIPNQWNTLTIAFNAKKALVLINNEVTLEIPVLKTDNTTGKIGLWALKPGWFSNFKVEPLKHDLSAIKEPSEVYTLPLITEWELSKSTSIDSLSEYISKTPNNIKTITAPTEPNGLLPISKYIKKTSNRNFEYNTEEFTIATKTIHSNSKKEVRFMFDYSDRCIVVLNGKKLFIGDNSFKVKGVQYMGHLNKKSNTLLLSLQKGNNLLQVFVIEKANGWGLIGSLEDIN
ncbi:hypothetical protein NBRC110019_27170 [Neptunitalea chrysea]|uniref:3-keto-disaccharide hydrolase domain-containing protein n=1 Tax=Neptunitalea chrysea TaxID=1647581 RepID=A0A9W6EW21_9FLAO|nr:DUF1080 domain-containing protein [Neptunitalea chrysea]GLB53676.1 hypothetical protein NBRC110019_27170 [Neptunitalea chrysea]